MAEVAPLKASDVPFDPEMTDEPGGLIDRVLAMDPWCNLGKEKTVRKHLVHNSRLWTCQPGEVVVREGDYGSSAFFILKGSVRVVLEGRLSAEQEGRSTSKKRSWFESLSQLWTNRKVPEARSSPGKHVLTDVDHPSWQEEHIPIHLPDMGVVLGKHKTAHLRAGEIFGEIGALIRAPRTASVFTEDPGTELLEIRWQGLRDLRKLEPFKQRLDDLYRERSLRTHLRSLPIFDQLGDTPSIRERLQAGQHAELLIEEIGLRQPRDPKPRLIRDLELSLTPVADSISRDGSIHAAVFITDGWAADEARQRALRAVCADLQAPVVIIWRGAPEGKVHWQWTPAESMGEGGAAPRVEEREQSISKAFLSSIIRELVLEELCLSTEFHSFGDLAKNTTSTKLSEEPIIVSEGQYPNGVYLMRSGFARISHSINGVDKTVSYICSPHAFGLKEIAHNWRAAKQQVQPVPYQHTLRCLGYVDVLFVPTAVVERHILPTLHEGALPSMISQRSSEAMLDPLATLQAANGMDGSTIEFLVDRRLISGKEAMVIDMERCTRCDDCVRACASTHDGNPRFLRHGPTHNRFMYANACMHCADPVCMIGCPTGAISRELAEGQVVINDPSCIGCGTCANNCPYDNIRLVGIQTESGNPFVTSKGKEITKATKCDLCIQQVGGPSCERACPHDALHRVDLNEVGNLVDWLKR